MATELASRQLDGIAPTLWSSHLLFNGASPTLRPSPQTGEIREIMNIWIYQVFSLVGRFSIECLDFRGQDLFESLIYLFGSILIDF